MAADKDRFYFYPVYLLMGRHHKYFVYTRLRWAPASISQNYYLRCAWSDLHLQWYNVCLSSAYIIIYYADFFHCRKWIDSDAMNLI